MDKIEYNLHLPMGVCNALEQSTHVDLQSFLAKREREAAARTETAERLGNRDYNSLSLYEDGRRHDRK